MERSCSRCLAAAAYADVLGREQPERRAEALELAELFCGQAKRRAEVLFEELWHNGDDANRDAAARVLDGHHRWLEAGILDPSGDGPMIPHEEITEPVSDERTSPSGSPAEPTVTSNR